VKRTYRLYREESLMVRKRRRKKLPVPERQPLVRPVQPNEVWSMDFVFDELANGRRVKTLTVVDDCSKESVQIVADTSIPALYVTRVLDQVKAERCLPRVICTDNGPEFAGRMMRPGRRRTVWNCASSSCLASRCRTPTSRASTAASATSACRIDVLRMPGGSAPMAQHPTALGIRSTMAGSLFGAYTNRTDLALLCQAGSQRLESQACKGEEGATAPPQTMRNKRRQPARRRFEVSQTD